MKVRHVAPGRKYYIWAMCDESGECQVTNVLMEVAQEHLDLAMPMTVLLHEVVPHDGPPLHDEYRAKMVYRDVIYELKADKRVGRKHLGFRVLFFFHPTEDVIVCTNAFLKTGNTPQECLDFALSERARFHENSHALEFVT